MTEGWFARLIEVVERDGRSLRELSVAARCGQNYLQQMIHDHKEPGAERLARILDVLGGPQSLYVLTGICASDDDLEVLSLIRRLNPEAKMQAISFFHALQDRAGS